MPTVDVGTKAGTYIRLPTRKLAAELVLDSPALRENSGVTQDQRSELTREAFHEIRIREGKLVAVKPRPKYVRSSLTVFGRKARGL